MKIVDSIKWGMRGLRMRRLRAALTILGIMIGTASVIALVSQTQGISVSISSQFSKLGPSTFTVRSASSSVALTQKDVNRISQIPGVALTIPMITTNIRVYGLQGARTFLLAGIDPTQFGDLISDYKISDGRMFQSISYSELLLGSNVLQPQDLTSPFINVEQSVTIQFGTSNPTRKVMNVVGALEPYGVTALVSIDDSIFMPIKGLSSMLSTNSYSVLFVKVVDPSSVDYAVNSLRAIYGSNINILTVKQVTQVVSTITGMLTVLLGAISGISLFVAAVGITNIMFVSVIERTREIGVLKALGFKGKDVLSIFLSEAALLGLIGGVLGSLMGFGISYILPILIGTLVSSNNPGGNGIFGLGSSSFSYTPIISFNVVLGMLAFAVVMSIIAGLYPARRASKMNPVDALRQE